MENNFFVSVFVEGKNISSYYSESLDELVTVKAIYKNCKIFILDMNTFQMLGEEEVEKEIIKSGKRWRAIFGKTQILKERNLNNITTPRIKKNNWARKVVCVETNEVFDSMRRCSEVLGIPYTTIVNCIKNKNPTRGVHFKLQGNNEL